MIAADEAHRKIADWFTGDKLADALRQAAAECESLAVRLLGTTPAVRRALKSAQYTVLMPLVEADLALFARKALLYRKLPGRLERDLFSVLGDPEKIENFDTGGRKITRNHRQAYQYYCEKILGEDGFKSDPTLPTGISLFFTRNPLAEAFLKRVTDNFLENLKTSIRRVAADRAAIETCFLGGAPIHAITNIESTGSDFHKGGQQVLFFDLAYRDGGGSEKTLRLVYKPSDVEFDYRIAGRNPPEFLAFLETHRSDPGFPIGHKSLYETLNDEVFQTTNRSLARQLSESYGPDAAQLEAALELPTYTILPRNPGSRLKVKEGSEGIRSSYGYIEYLEHAPENTPSIPPGAFADASELAAWIAETYGNASDRELSRLDWITRSPVEALVCYRLWGRIIAIATVFQQTDLHHQNLRLRGRRPHVIDLENALVKTIPGPDTTGIPFNFESLVSGQIEFEPAYQSGPVPQTDPSPVRLSQVSIKQWATSVLWMLGPGGHGSVLAEPVTSRIGGPSSPPPNPAIARQLAEGLAEAMRLMAQPTYRSVVTRWVDEVGLHDVVVRNVVEATGDLKGAVAGFIGRCVDSRSRSEKDTLAAYCANRRKKRFTTWENAGSDEQNPYFALNTARWHGADFRNLDVPSYYQQVQSHDLLSSRGNRVTYIAPEDAAQEEKEQPYAFTHYLVKTGSDLLRESFATNLPADEEALTDRIEAFLAQSKLLLPKARLDRILGR